jgi:hypothetical protein
LGCWITLIIAVSIFGIVDLGRANDRMRILPACMALGLIQTQHEVDSLEAQMRICDVLLQNWPAKLALRKPPSSSPNGRREPTRVPILVGSPAAGSEDVSFEEF